MATHTHISWSLLPLLVVIGASSSAPDLAVAHVPQIKEVPPSPVAPAHGSLDMPIWGPVFRNARGDAAAAVRLANLVKFLESLQQK